MSAKTAEITNRMIATKKMIFAISTAKTRDPTKAEDSRNQRNNQKCQSPTKHGGAPSLSKCAQRLLCLRITLFINDQCAGMFRQLPFGDGSARPPDGSGAELQARTADAVRRISRIAPKDARLR